MLKQFTQDEALHLWTLIREHYVAILAACFSTAVFVAIHMQGYYFYDFEDRGINHAVYYGLVPLLFGILVLRKSPTELGLGLGNYRFWIPTSLLFIVIIIPIIYISFELQSMQQAYYQKDFDFQEYIIETLLIMLGWEFILRGFLLGALRDSLKEGSILVQMIPFTLLHMGLPGVVTYGCILSGLVFGYLSYRGESFWPSFIVHMVINVAVNLLAVGYFKQ